MQVFLETLMWIHNMKFHLSLSVFTMLHTIVVTLMTYNHQLCDRCTTLHLQNAQTYSLHICIKVSHLTFLHVSVRQRHSSGNQTKVVQHETKLFTFVQNRRGVKYQVVKT